MTNSTLQTKTFSQFPQLGTVTKKDMLYVACGFFCRAEKDKEYTRAWGDLAPAHVAAGVNSLDELREGKARPRSIVMCVMGDDATGYFPFAVSVLYIPAMTPPRSSKHEGKVSGVVVNVIGGFLKGMPVPQVGGGATEERKTRWIRKMVLVDGETSFEEWPVASDVARRYFKWVPAPGDIMPCLHLTTPDAGKPMDVTVKESLLLCNEMVDDRPKLEIVDVSAIEDGATVELSKVNPGFPDFKKRLVNVSVPNQEQHGLWAQYLVLEKTGKGNGGFLKQFGGAKPAPGEPTPRHQKRTRYPFASWMGSGGNRFHSPVATQLEISVPGGLLQAEAATSDTLVEAAEATS